MMMLLLSEGEGKVERRRPSFRMLVGKQIDSEDGTIPETLECAMLESLEI